MEGKLSRINRYSKKWRRWRKNKKLRCLQQVTFFFHFFFSAALCLPQFLPSLVRLFCVQSVTVKTAIRTATSVSPLPVLRTPNRKQQNLKVWVSKEWNRTTTSIRILPTICPSRPQPVCESPSSASAPPPTATDGNRTRSTSESGTLNRHSRRRTPVVGGKRLSCPDLPGPDGAGGEVSIRLIQVAEDEDDVLGEHLEPHLVTVATADLKGNLNHFTSVLFSSSSLQRSLPMRWSASTTTWRQPACLRSVSPASGTSERRSSGDVGTTKSTKSSTCSGSSRAL